MHCGQMLARPMPGQTAYGTSPAMAMPVPASKKKVGLIALIAGLAILALFGGLFATGALRLGSKQNPDANLQASGKNSPPTLQASGEQPPPSLVATGEQPPPNLQASAAKKYMPDDIRAWLEHLERIEKRKCKLVSEQIAAALVQLQYLLGADATKDILNGLLKETSGDPADEMENPANETKKSIGELNHEWDVLITDFNSFPPPPACVPLRNEYDQHIREVKGQIGDIVRVFDSASDNPDAAIEILRGIQKDNRKGIDQPGVRSERLLEEVCAQYDTKPWFSIDPDPGRGKGLLGSRGF